jgi:hypothetical protein
VKSLGRYIVTSRVQGFMQDGCSEDREGCCHIASFWRRIGAIQSLLEGVKKGLSMDG